MRKLDIKVGDKFGDWIVINTDVPSRNWVTYQANVSKHTMTMEQLYEFCRKVLNYANQQPSQPLTKLEGSETNS